MTDASRYVLITTAKDEERFVGPMLESVAAQSLRPLRHVVVDDGSRDATPKIVQSLAAKEPFIRLKKKDGTNARSFGSKVDAFQAAYEDLKNLQFDFVGCLDADITLPADYYQRIIEKMALAPTLGLASGLCLQKYDGRCLKVMSNSRHVPGALQLFRRRCFDAIGGYQRVTVAGVDSLAEIKARMLGWETRSFEDIHGYHHKPIGSATGGGLRTSCRRGMTDYLLGKHPLYVLAKGVRRLAAPPYVLGSAAHLWGFFSLLLANSPLDVTEDVKTYVRAEEMTVLKNAIFHGARPY